MPSSSDSSPAAAAAAAPSTAATIEVEPKPSRGDIAEDAAATELVAELVEDLSLDEPKQLEEPKSNMEAVISGDTPYTSAKRFEDLNLSEELLKGLHLWMKFERPSRIQAVTLPMILSPPFKNLIAQAPNGSGKTVGFVLEMLSRVDPNIHAPQALCVVHTRELAHQNLEVLKKMGKYMGITAECALPDTIEVKNRERITAQVVIGTTGTLKRLISFGKLSLDCMKDYNQLFVKKEDLSLETVKQYKVNCPDKSAKVQVIKDRVLEFGEKVGQTIIFVRTRSSAGRLHKALVDIGYEVTTIQGALTHEDRDKIVKEFKDGLTKVLISTDLLARGFDQSQARPSFGSGL